MNCKECGAKIPEGTKYCPDCGAIVNNYSQPNGQPQMNYNYSGAQHPNQNSQPVYPGQSHTNNQPSYPGQIDENGMPVYTSPGNQPSGKKKTNAKNIILRIVISVVVFAVASVISSIFYSNRSSSGSEPENSYEQLAVEYIDNMINGANTQIFMNASALNYETVYSDMVDYYCYAYETTIEDYYASMSEQYGTTIATAHQMVQADIELINEYWKEAIEEEFGVNTVSCSIDSVDTLSDAELQSTIDLVNDYLAVIELTVDDYINTASITEAYEIDVEIVIDGSKISDEYTNVDTFSTTVIKINGEYKVFYDEYLIDTMLYLMGSEGE